MAAALLVGLAACSPQGTPTGRELAVDVGCVSCHTDEDTALAPTWHGLHRSMVDLEDGTSVTADEAYLRRSILEPRAEVVEGYRPTMPRFELTHEELDHLVEHIMELGR